MSTVHHGNENNDPIGITIPSDGQGPIKAADVNPAFQGTFDKVTALQARVGNVDALNFVYTTVLKTGANADVIGAAAWVAERNRWALAAKPDTTHIHVRLWTGTYDVSEATIGPVTVASSIWPIAMAAHPTADKAVIACHYTGPVTAIATVLVYDAGSLAEETFSVGAAGYVPKGVVHFAGKWIVVFANGADHAFASSADAATWTEGAGADGFVVAHDAPLLVAASPTVCVACPRNTVGEDDSPWTPSKEVLRTADGATWTTHDLPFAGAFWTGLTYDAKRGVFVLAGYMTDEDYGIVVLTSQDGITWTMAASFFEGRPWGIAEHNGLWIVPVTEVHGSDREIAFSTDAGVTWHVAGGGFDFDGGLTGSMFPLPLSNGRQVIIATDQRLSGSLLSRLPPYPLEVLP